jgi:hypothetical protein
MTGSLCVLGKKTDVFFFFPCIGGGIFNGSLGSMLPYIVKAKEDKMGIVMFDDVFHDSMRGKDIDVRTMEIRNGKS